MAYPPPAPSRKGLWAAVALVALLVGAGATLGILYYQGWLDSDPDPPVRAVHRPPPPRPHPTPAPTHRGGQLR